MLPYLSHQQFQIIKKKKKVNSYVSARCNLWIIFSTCYQSLIQFKLGVNSWKVVKRMTKQYYHSFKESRVEVFFMSIFFAIIIKFNMEEKIKC